MTNWEERFSSILPSWKPRKSPVSDETSCLVDTRVQVPIQTTFQHTHNANIFCNPDAQSCHRLFYLNSQNNFYYPIVNIDIHRKHDWQYTIAVIYYD
jgi:hypothetical protein